jgi:hypothetical protein
MFATPPGSQPGGSVLDSYSARKKAHDHSMDKAKSQSPPCPKCGGPTRVVLIEPPNEAGLERRMYHCVLDECSGNVVVMFP